MGSIIKCVGRSQSQDEGGESMDMVEDWMGVLYLIFNPELPLVMNAPMYAPISLKNTYTTSKPSQSTGLPTSGRGSENATPVAWSASATKIFFLLVFRK